VGGTRHSSQEHRVDTVRTVCRFTISESVDIPEPYRLVNVLQWSYPHCAVASTLELYSTKVVNQFPSRCGKDGQRAPWEGHGSHRWTFSAQHTLVLENHPSTSIRHPASVAIVRGERVSVWCIIEQLTHDNEVLSWPWLLPLASPSTTALSPVF
jgi:hypothetical protein